MEIITGTKEELRKIIDDAYLRLERCKNIIDRYAMADYISQLHDLMSMMSGEEEGLDQIRCFGRYRKQKKYYDYLDSLFDKLDENFCKYKSFHSEMFGEIIDIHDEGLDVFLGTKYSSGSVDMTKEEFYEYFFEFLKQYGLESRFDRFIEKRRIFNRSIEEGDRFAGCCLHDPIKKDSSIAFCGFQYNIPYLTALAHEFGHTYDLSKIKGDNLGYKNLIYSYQSPYGEVVAMLFEKLFYDYLFDKKYRLEQVKDLMIDNRFVNRQNVMAMYILTLLDDEQIFIGPGELPKEIILEQVRPYFENDDEINWFVGVRKFDTWKEQAYGYGEIISTIMKENVKEEGLNSELMRTFMSNRFNMFDPKFVLDNGFEPNNYQKVFQKDLARIKK